MSESPLICHRCGADLHPGSGDYYFVHIEAFVDPSGPVLEDQGPGYDPRREIERLAEQMKDVSPQEAMDQVYRQVTLHLCTACYGDWIENPAGA